MDVQGQLGQPSYKMLEKQTKACPHRGMAEIQEKYKHIKPCTLSVLLLLVFSY